MENEHQIDLNLGLAEEECLIIVKKLETKAVLKEACHAKLICTKDEMSRVKSCPHSPRPGYLLPFGNNWHPGCL